jgi:IS30 family transposase
MRRLANKATRYTPELWAMITDNLAHAWSPAAIAGRLCLEQGKQHTSYEKIYQWTYHDKKKVGHHIVTS